MSDNKIFIGDIGTEIILDAGSDLSSESTLEIHYLKPSGATGIWEASVYQTNYAKYTTLADDLDEAGVWRFRIYTVLASWTGYGVVDTHEIFELEW